MTEIFRSKENQAHFDEFGYVILDARLEPEADEMSRFIAPHLSGISSEFYYSLIANSYEENKRIREKIKSCLQSFYNQYLQAYKPLNESFLVKPANTSSELLLHQDWCYTDERKFPSLTLWMPLCDVDENNGALFFVPGSHKWFNNLRSCGLPTARISSKDVPGAGLKSVVMKKGQVLLFHSASFHGSFPNNSDKNRPVVTSVILPENAPYLYYYASKEERNDTVATFQLDEDVYLRELHTMAIGAEPSSGKVNEFPYKHREISPADILSRFKEQQHSV